MSSASTGGPPAAAAEADFRRLHPLTPLLRGWAFLVAGVIAVGQQAFGDLDVLMLAVTGAAVMVLGMVAGAVSWWFTRYRIDADELRVESGVFVRRSRRIRIERLQAVDVVQPLVGRLLGLAELRLEVAGGARTEAPLAYLSVPEAHRVRTTLLSRTAVATEPPGSPAAGLAAWPGGVPVRPPLFRVPGELLLAGLLLSTQFLAPVVSLVLIGIGLTLAGQPLGLALLLPWLAAIAAVVARNFIAQYGFTVHEGPDGLRIRRGLLDVRSQTLPPGRVQGIAVVEPLLWRPRRWVRLDVDVAGYVGSGEDSAGGSVSTLLPVAPRAAAGALIERVLPGLRLRGIPMAPASRAARWLRPVGWRFLAAGADGFAVVTTEGWLVRRTDVVPHVKTQSVRIRQGPVQRRLGLADVYVDSPPGPVRAIARHRDARDARALAMAQVARARTARLSA